MARRPDRVLSDSDSGKYDSTYIHIHHDHPIFIKYKNKYFDGYVPQQLKSDRTKKLKTQLLNQSSGEFFKREDGNIDKALSFSNPYDDLTNSKGRKYVLSAARTKSLTLGARAERIANTNHTHPITKKRGTMSPFCPHGCKDKNGTRILEKEDHFFGECPRWDEEKEKLLQSIKNLVQIESPEATVALLPSWFIRKEKRPPTADNTHPSLKNLSGFDPSTGCLAFCPSNLLTALKAIGVDGGRTRRLAGRILARISNFFFNTYKTAYPDNDNDANQPETPNHPNQVATDPISSTS